MDIFERINHDAGGPLGQYWEKAHGYYMFPKLEGELGPHMKFQGKECLNWSLNNYLGLANHPEIRKVDGEAAVRWGLAYPMGSRMLTGHTALHEQLERELADFEKKEDAFLFNFGYQGIVSTIQTLLTRADVVVHDKEAHACLIDGCMLANKAERLSYRHNDIAHFDKVMQRATEITNQTGGGILVITEGVYGMTGALGNIGELVEMKKKYNFRLMIDDAHGFGVTGPTGRGTSEHFGVMDGVDLYIGAYAKSMAIIGGFVAGPKTIINYLRYNMRSQIYAKALPMAIVEGCLKRLEIIRGAEGDRLRAKLWEVTRALQDGFRNLGFEIGPAEACVTPVFMKGGVVQATNIVIDLRSNYNIFCSTVTWPVVPKGVLMFRIIPTAAHTLEDVEYTLKVFAEIKAKLDAGEYDKGDMIDMSIK
ncbi:MAG: pyridoxal phosphate-dependent aminotransferase family protein [Bacteroidales bacterium]|nr:pyridoxal phosphate-dependent aminotransferase family protein [Bacteroidales bacterium]